MKTNQIIILIAVLACVGSFFGGMKFAEFHDRSGFPNGMGGPMMGEPFPFGDSQGQQRGIRSVGGFVTGEILSLDDESITVKLADGGSKIVFFSEATPVTKSVEGASSDLAVGAQVMTTGSQNDDGSLTAQSIQIIPTSVAGSAPVSPAPSVPTTPTPAF